MTREQREGLNTGVDSLAWRALLDQLVQSMRAWSIELLENEQLDEGRRRGLVIALREVKSRILAVYELAGREVPSWLRQEIWFYRDSLS